MAAEITKTELSEGECTDDEDGEEDLDTSICKACNLNFNSAKAFYTHIHSVSHLRKTSELAKSPLGDISAVGGVTIPPPPPPPVINQTASQINLRYSDNAYIAPPATVGHSTSHDQGLFSSGHNAASFSRSPGIPGLGTPAQDSLHSPQKNIMYSTAAPFSRPQIVPLMSIPIVRDHFFNPVNGGPSAGIGSIPEVVGHAGHVPPLMSPWMNSTDSEAATYSMSVRMSDLVPSVPLPPPPPPRTALTSGGDFPSSQTMEMVECHSGDFSLPFSHNSAVKSSDSQNSSQKVPVAASEMLTQPDPVIGGRWLMMARKHEATGESFTCQGCKVTYNDQLFYDLHMAGLRHLKTTAELPEPVLSVSLEDSMPEVAIKKLNVTDMVERNANLFQQLSSYVGELGTDNIMDPVVDATSRKTKLTDRVEKNVDLFKQLTNLVEPMSDSLTTEQPGLPADANVSANIPEVDEVKMNVADILERNVDVFQKLSHYVEPVLGVDYISEYHFLDGRIEHVCHLCELTLNIPVILTEHASSIPHLLRYIFYHEPSSYKLISDSGKCSDISFIHHIAADIEKTLGLQQHTRVFVETASTSEFGMLSYANKQRSHWVEQKDERIRAISALRGHLLYADYSFVCRPDDASPVKDLPSLLQTLARYSCFASGRPPSMVKTVSRMDLLSSLAAFEVTNDNDAEVSLQIANALTLGLLSYRMQMLPTLRATDRTKFEARIVRLRDEAESVAAKTSGRSINPAENSTGTASTV
jgi:hypothetical protein